MFLMTRVQMLLVLQIVTKCLPEFLAFRKRTSITDLHLEPPFYSIASKKQRSLLEFDTLVELVLMVAVGVVVREYNMFIQTVANTTLHSALFYTSFVVAQSAHVLVVAVAHSYKV